MDRPSPSNAESLVSLIRGVLPIRDSYVDLRLSQHVVGALFSRPRFNPDLRRCSSKPTARHEETTPAATSSNAPAPLLVLVAGTEGVKGGIEQVGDIYDDGCEV